MWRGTRRPSTWPCPCASSRTLSRCRSKTTANPSRWTSTFPPKEKTGWAWWACRSACDWSMGVSPSSPPRVKEPPCAWKFLSSPAEKESPMQKINVLLADDHTVVRQGFRALLEAEQDIAVVGEADTGRLAVGLTKKLRPDVVLMDIAMPLLNGLEATRQVLKEVPGTKVLILSSYSDDEYVQQLTEAGAAGYLLKQTAAAYLLKA